MPDHTEVYDRIASRYAHRWDDSTVTGELGGFVHRVGYGPVLDAGCGPGRDLAAMGAAGVDAVGVDASVAMASLARERGLEVCVADLGSLPFGDGVFRGVWASASLVHLDDTEAGVVLGELRRVTAAGGRARVTVKAAGPGGVPGPVDEGDERWFRWWTPDGFAAVAEAARWGVEWARYEEDRVRDGLRWVVVELVRGERTLS